MSDEVKQNDLLRLAQDVLKEYSIKTDSISVIQDANIKTVWKLTSGKETLCLKRLKQSYDKALFSVNAQHYVKSLGGNVPGIIKDKNNKLIVNHNDQLFVVYEWIKGKDIDLDNPNDLKESIQGLAKFHTFTKGYKAPAEARISTKLGKWPEQYESMKTKLSEWDEISKQKSNSCYQTYTRYAVDMVDIADRAIEYLKSSSYDSLTNENSDAPVLCHQDYGKGNAVLTDFGVHVIDLDGVTFDHPSRDLRKIIGKRCENKGSWDKDIIDNITKWYSEVNPLTSDERKLLFIDLLYPHWFFGLVKNIFKNNKLENSSKIERIAKLEKSKVALLESLIKRGG